ncbi:MAG: hypothetical protein RIR55_1615 [Bacteroidota bacterium]|jgi:hypothetical protein
MGNITLYLALYGSIISTLAFTWNVFQYYRNKKGKLRITAALNTKIPIVYGRNSMSHFFSLDIIVVNLSEKTRYIQQPTFELNQKMNSSMNFLDLDNPVKYPVQLNSGEEFSVWFNIDNLNSESLQKITANKFRIVITDTHGKEYKSKWYSTRDFKLKR